MSDIISKIKQLAMSSDDRLLLKYGLIDECGDLTWEGDVILTQILFEENKAQLVERIKAVDAEWKVKDD